MNDYPSASRLISAPGRWFLLSLIATFFACSTPPSSNKKEAEVEPLIPSVKLVPGGTFIMGVQNGDPDERPIHEVIVDSFELGLYEVTNAEFCAFLNAKGNQIQGDNGKPWLREDHEYCYIEKKGNTYVPIERLEQHPVALVSWFGAHSFCQWLSEKTGQNWRLPTEAEWEYAAGGGSEEPTMWAGTNNEKQLPRYANLSRRDPWKDTAPVGSFEPNYLGLYDMSGNLREWCSDWYDASFYRDERRKDNPTGPPTGRSKVNRGGSWGSSAEDMRITNRNAGSPDINRYYIGFRLARDL